MNGLPIYMRKGINIQPDRMLAALPGLFYLANLLRLLNVSIIPYYIALALVGSAGVLYILVQKKVYVGRIVIILGLYLLSLVLNWLIIKNYGADSIVNNILLMGIAILMILKPCDLVYGAFVFYATAVILLSRIIASGSESRRILTSSSNFISVVLLLSCSFYYISLEKTQRKIRLLDLLPAGICLYISVWARGRGGILSCTFLLLLMGLLYVKVFAGGNVKRKLLVLAGLLIAVTVMFLVKFSPIDFFLGLGKWGERGASSGDRLAIWGSYFAKVRESVIYFLFGAPLDDIPGVASYEGNLHNSFLQLHAYSGIVMLFVLIALIVKSLVFYIKTRRYILAIMMMTITLRGITDKFIFGQYGMPVMLFFVLYPFVLKQNIRKPLLSGGDDNE